MSPHPERVSEAYAMERIREKINRLPEERQRVGFWNVDRRLKEEGVPAAFRLHYISAVAGLGQRAAEELDMRLDRLGESP